MNSTEITLLLVTFPICLLSTAGVRRYSLRHGVLDVPNTRSSHSVVTPRGGGLAVALVFLTVTLFGWAIGAVDNGVAIALSGGGAMVAGVGWMDDRRSLPAFIRAIVHFLSAFWALYWLKGFPTLELGNSRLALGGFSVPFGVLLIVWLINLYNFMDGIDGLAGSEALVVALIGATLVGKSGAWDLVFLLLALALTVGGFLVWNWPPAKIFMGDVGSGLLGYCFAVLAISSNNRQVMPLIVWVLLLGVFVVDATVTLIRRALTGERLHEAHRSHVYQLAVQNGYTHRAVTLSIVGVDVVLGAFGWLVSVDRTFMPFVIIGAFVALTVIHVLLYLRFVRAPVGQPAIPS